MGSSRAFFFRHWLILQNTGEIQNLNIQENFHISKTLLSCNLLRARKKITGKKNFVQQGMYGIIDIWEMLIALFALFCFGVNNDSKWKTLIICLKIYFSCSCSCWHLNPYVREEQIGKLFFHWSFHWHLFHWKFAEIGNLAFHSVKKSLPFTVFSAFFFFHLLVGFWLVGWCFFQCSGYTQDDWGVGKIRLQQYSIKELLTATCHSHTEEQKCLNFCLCMCSCECYLAGRKMQLVESKEYNIFHL